jgi:hypothetical protein
VYARLLCLDKRRPVLAMCVSSVSTKGDTCCEPVSPLSRRKGQLLGPSGQYQERPFVLPFTLLAYL